MVLRNATIKHVKRVLEERTGIPSVMQRLIYADKHTQDKTKLDEVSLYPDFRSAAADMTIARHQGRFSSSPCARVVRLVEMLLDLDSFKRMSGGR